MTRTAEAVPPHAWFGVSAVFHYLGPSFAVLLFPAIGVLGVAWFRIASAALVFAPITKPWRTFRRSTSRQRVLLVSLGACLAGMNSAFYLALERLPIALVAAIEFVGTLGIALWGVQSGRNGLALAFAVALAVLWERLAGGIYLYSLPGGGWVHALERADAGLWLRRWRAGDPADHHALAAAAISAAWPIAILAGLAFVMGLRSAVPMFRRSVHGDARWATRREIKRAGLLDGQGVVAGRVGRFGPVVTMPVHTALRAQTGDGKGVAVGILHLPLQQLGRTRDGGQRRFQLVRDVVGIGAQAGSAVLQGVAHVDDALAQIAELRRAELCGRWRVGPPGFDGARMSRQCRDWAQHQTP